MTAFLLARGADLQGPWRQHARRIRETDAEDPQETTASRNLS
jgi:hypothetical protein